MRNSATSCHRTVFVTVGTTAFDALILAVTEREILTQLSTLGYTKLRLQIGRASQRIADHLDTLHSPIELEHYRFKASLRQDFSEAALVIGHAGAGTCLEVLELEKPLLVVINEQLHDNHQFELARRLKKDGYLEYCIPEQLGSILSNRFDSLDRFRPFPNGDPKLFADWLENYLFDE